MNSRYVYLLFTYSMNDVKQILLQVKVYIILYFRPIYYARYLARNYEF